MITAAQYEFCKNGPASIHNVSNFLKLSGLAPFVATSYSSQRKVANNMDNSIISFDESEQKRLIPKMPEKWITLCEDETFHPAICMVAIEAVSNFIILEKYVENRNGQTWNRVVGNALEGLPVKVIQVTSDEAKGLINHTEKGLGAHHSPDVFHVSYEIGRGTSGALAGKIKKVEKHVEAAIKQTQREIKTKERYDNQPNAPGAAVPILRKRLQTPTNKKDGQRPPWILPGKIRKPFNEPSVKSENVITHMILKLGKNKTIIRWPNYWDIISKKFMALLLDCQTAARNGLKKPIVL